MARRITLTYPRVLLCCFFCGTAAGTIMANCLGRELLGQLAGSGLTELRGRTADAATGQRSCFLRYVARRRLSELGLAVLAGMTPLSSAAFAAAAFCGGFVSGLLIAVLTLEKGLGGLPVFFLAVLPQWICYLPVWMILAAGAEDGLTGIRARSWVILAVLSAAGIFLEAAVNPIFLRF